MNGSERMRKWRLDNPEKAHADAIKSRDRVRQWRIDNPDRAREAVVKCRAAKPEKYRAYRLKYYQANKELCISRAAARNKAKPRAHRAAVRKWLDNRPGYSAAHCAKRRATLVQRTPAWADSYDTACWYELAAVLSRSGVAYHVDHEMPLHGKRVSGLHTPNNMRVVPWWINISKGNKHAS